MINYDQSLLWLIVINQGTQQWQVDVYQTGYFYFILLQIIE